MIADRNLWKYPLHDDTAFHLCLEFGERNAPFFSKTMEEVESQCLMLFDRKSYKIRVYFQILVKAEFNKLEALGVLL